MVVLLAPDLCAGLEKSCFTSKVQGSTTLTALRGRA